MTEMTEMIEMTEMTEMTVEFCLRNKKTRLPAIIKEDVIYNSKYGFDYQYCLTAYEKNYEIWTTDTEEQALCVLRGNTTSKNSTYARPERTSDVDDYEVVKCQLIFH